MRADHSERTGSEGELEAGIPGNSKSVEVMRVDIKNVINLIEVFHLL